MVVWRRKDENLMFFDAERRRNSASEAPLRSPISRDVRPRPFSMASPDVVSSPAARRPRRYTRITFERLDVETRVGVDVDEAVDFAMTLGPAGEVLRLAGAEAERRRPEVVDALRALFRPKLRAEGVIAESSSWLVSARA